MQCPHGTPTAWCPALSSCGITPKGHIPSRPHVLSKLWGHSWGHHIVNNLVPAALHFTWRQLGNNCASLSRCFPQLEGFPVLDSALFGFVHELFHDHTKWPIRCLPFFLCLSHLCLTDLRFCFCLWLHLLLHNFLNGRVFFLGLSPSPTVGFSMALGSLAASSPGFCRFALSWASSLLEAASWRFRIGWGTEGLSLPTSKARAAKFLKGGVTISGSGV